MMVAMGIYDKLIHSITHLRKEFKESMKFFNSGICRCRNRDCCCCENFGSVLCHVPDPDKFTVLRIDRWKSSVYF